MLAPQAKLWPASEAVAGAALELLRLRPEDVLADFGCGNGVALFLAVQRFGCRGAVGYEINAERALATRAAAAAAGLVSRVAVHAQNALDADASGRDGVSAVYLYLIARGLALILPLLRRLAAAQPARALRVATVLYRIPGEAHVEMRKVFSGPGNAVMTQIYLYSISAETPAAGGAGDGGGGGGGDGAGGGDGGSGSGGVGGRGGGGGQGGGDDCGSSGNGGGSSDSGGGGYTVEAATVSDGADA